MIEVLFGVLVEGLKLWNSKEATKYIDEIYQLQKDWLSEYEKPRKDRNNSELDDIEQRLHIIGKIFIAASGKSKV